MPNGLRLFLVPHNVARLLLFEPLEQLQKLPRLSRQRHREVFWRMELIPVALASQNPVGTQNLIEIRVLGFIMRKKFDLPEAARSLTIPFMKLLNWKTATVFLFPFLLALKTASSPRISRSKIRTAKSSIFPILRGSRSSSIFIPRMKPPVAPKRLARSATSSRIQETGSRHSGRLTPGRAEPPGVQIQAQAPI